MLDWKYDVESRHAMKIKEVQIIVKKVANIGIILSFKKFINLSIFSPFYYYFNNELNIAFQKALSSGTSPLLKAES